jgi:CubicO group peptidase (beta-lactamase class C family)
MGVVQGAVEAGFEPVRELFEQQFAAEQHIGAGVAAYHRGRKVVDLWGGLADGDTGSPWAEDTMAASFSTTKGLTATCLHLLADRGLVKYDDPVSKYWPEFAVNGKAAITIYQLLTHQAGVPQLPDGITTDDLCDWEKMVHGIEELTPLWEPGTNSGYHAITFGFLIGEVVRRVDGRSLGTFFRDEIAAPLGMSQIHIGTPASLDAKVATLKSTVTITPEMEKQRAAFLGPTSLAGRALGIALPGNMNDMLNSPAGHRAEIPAVNGIMSARDLARMYACLAGYGEIDGTRLLSERTVRTMSEQQTHRPDLVIILPVGWALGYMTGGDPGWPQGPRKTSFGHPGFGGSVGHADPEIGLSFGLVVNALALDLIGAGRTAALADAVRVCAEAL